MPNHITRLGTAFKRGEPVTFGINPNDRLHHMFILGQTGTGKSTMLRSMAMQDAKNDEGFCLIDPHGDVAKDLHHSIGRDHIYWNLADPNSPYGYNPIPKVSAGLRPLIASGFIDTLRHQWSDAWGPRMENLLRWGVLALLDQPSATILDLMPLYTDKQFRKQAILHIEDTECRRFWQVEYPELAYKNAFDGVAPIANKLGALIADPKVRKALSSAQTPLQFRKLMDESAILIVNLAKGRLGSELANIMGGLIVTGLRNAAFSRQNLSEGARKPYFVSVDEFHNFTSHSIAESLSELRKYKLGMCLAGQHISQVTAATQDAIFGNAGTTVAFRLGISDANLMQRYLQFPSEADLLNQPNHRAYCRLMIDGVQTKAFSMETVPP